MSDTNNSSSTNGLGLIGIVFVILKLTHVIDWSWWYVTLPFWGGFVLMLGFLLLAGLVAGIGAGIVLIVESFKK